MAIPLGSRSVAQATLQGTQVPPPTATADERGALEAEAEVDRLSCELNCQRYGATEHGKALVVFGHAIQKTSPPPFTRWAASIGTGKIAPRPPGELDVLVVNRACLLVRNFMMDVWVSGHRASCDSDEQ